MPSHRPLISFDAAGTLIQVAEPVGRTYATFAARHGLRVEEAPLKAAFRAVWGALPARLWPEGARSPDDDKSWWHALVREVFASALGTPVEAQTLDPLFEELYAWFARPGAWVVYEDVMPALVNLAQDHQFCITSNFDRRLHSILAGHGLDRFFPHVILSSEVGASKPHRRMFDAALQATGAVAEESLHVGDDPVCDIEGARVCGWQAYAVGRPGHGLDLLVEKVRTKSNSNLRSL